MTAEELLKQMSAEPFAEEMVCCVIDPETRVIDVPAEYQLLGVESDEKVERMRKLKEHFIEGVLKIEDTVIHGLPDATSAPHIISVGFAGIRSEVLLHALEEKGIYVSSGSACASNHPQVSGVLKGIGAKQEFLDATLRFSLSEFTTLEEIDYTLDTLYNIVPILRKYTRR